MTYTGGADLLGLVRLRGLLLTLLGCAVLTLVHGPTAAAGPASMSVGGGRFVCVRGALKAVGTTALTFAQPEARFVRGALRRVEMHNRAAPETEQVHIFVEDAVPCDISKGDVLVTLTTTVNQARDLYVVDVVARGKWGNYSDKVVRKPARVPDLQIIAPDYPMSPEQAWA